LIETAMKLALRAQPAKRRRSGPSARTL